MKVKTDYKEKIFEELKKTNNKLTEPRKIVIETLLNQSGKHPTVEELYNNVKEVDASIGQATVYRTISLLYRLNLVQKLDFYDGLDRYEIIKSNHHHHHLVCNTCGNVLEVLNDHLEKIESHIVEKYGFKIQGHILKFNGICKNCDKKMNGEK